MILHQTSNLQQKILDQLLLVMALGATLVMVLSSLRIAKEGLEPKFAIMWSLAFSIISLKLAYKRLHPEVVGYILYCVFSAMGFTALLNDGLASIGPIFLFLGLSTSAVVIRAKNFFILVGLQCLAFMILSLLVTSGKIAPMPSDASNYMLSGRTWVFHGIITATGAALSFYGSSILGQWYRQNLTETKNSFYSAISILSLARDTETGEHITRVSYYADILYDALCKSKFYELDFSKSELSQAVRLHDVGKIAIRDSLLKKPGKLTSSEFEEMKRHSEVGADIIASIRNQRDASDRILELAERIALSHHENWNGSGYPHSLSHEAIPLEARIMAIADVYDALRSKRPYKNGFSHEQALKIMTDMCGKKFDPALFAVFLDVSDDFKDVYDSILILKATQA